VAEPLVYYRVGATAFKRRGGLALLRSELRLQREFRRLRFTTTPQCVRNILIRGGYRLVPWWLRRAVYQPVVSRYAAHPASVPAAPAAAPAPVVLPEAPAPAPPSKPRVTS
jgi:hypothetical protein